MTFQSLVDEFLAREHEVSPVHASQLGLTAYDDRVDDLSAASFDARNAEDADWLGRFDALGDGGLAPAEQIDRGLVLSVLRGRLIMADWQSWRRDPATYTDVALGGIFTLFLHRLRPEPELIESALARMREIPRVLAQGTDNLARDLAHPVVLRRGAGAARGGARYLQDLLPLEVGAGGDGRDRLAAQGAEAGRAMGEWAAHLDGLAGEASGTWRLGEERYTRLLREKEMLDVDARQLRELGRAEYGRLAAEMARVALRARGTDDWRRVLDEARRDHPATEADMRQGYADWTARARAFLAEHGLVTLPPGEQCVVDPSPVFQRPVLGVASYNAPPPFSESWTGHFFVPFAPDSTPEAEIQERLRANSWGDIPTISVHETYPGHHWHLVMRKRGPRAVRRVFGTPYFTEGWALYAERMMRERGYFTDPIHELFHLDATLFRAARIVVDTSLHLGEMTFDEAVEFMRTKAGLPEPTAKAEVGRYCSRPTQASAYLTGCLEILRIRRAWLDAHGFEGVIPADVPAEALRQFHDTIAESGALPLGLAARVMAGAGI
jgi:uncharacterized protein (DUF885 family)